MFIAPWKLRPPSALASQARRLRLLDQGGVVGNRHTLVVAPAGFGKSMLLAALFQSRLEEGLKCAWMTLGEADDPAYFVTLLSSAFEAADRGLGDEGGQISTLLQGLEGYDRPLALFLDDADLAPEATRRLIAELVRDAPSKMQVLIAARESAKLPLARLRTAGALHVTDAADLLLDEHDFAELGEGLDERQLQYVCAASGGWPVAAAGLAAGSRAGGRLRCSYQECGLFEYIEQEVVTSLTADEEKVLTACALLSPITAVASARITDLAQAPEHLARSAQKLSGLVSQVDGPDAGYRLNPVLKAFFVARLLSAEPAVSSRAVEQSCAALTLQGRVAEAVRIAQEAHRSDLAVSIIQDQDAIVWWLTAGINEVREVLRFAGPALIVAHPRLQLMSAIANLKSGSHAEAERLYNRAEAAWASAEPRGELNVVRIALLVYGCRVPTASDLELFRDLAAQTRIEPTWRTFVDSAVCVLQIENGEFEAAGMTAASAIASAGSSEQPYAVLYLNYHIAAISAARGDTRRAREMLRSGRAIHKAQFSTDRGAETIGAIETAELDYEVGHLSAARVRLRSINAELHHMEGWFDIYAAAFTTAARVMRHDLGLAAAREYLRTVGQGLRRKGLERVADHLLTVDRLLVGEAKLNGRVSDGADGPAIWRPLRAQGWREFEALRLGEAYGSLGSGSGGEAIATLDELIADVDRRGALRPHLRALLLKAVALEQVGEQETAYECFLQAIGLGRKTGFRRSFLDFGGAANDARLRRAAEDAETDDARFAASLLPQMRMQASENEAVRLTPREHEVLSGLESGASDKMLGRRLGVSEHAVRFHLKNIFVKLHVHTRVEAIAKARHMRVLGPT